MELEINFAAFLHSAVRQVSLFAYILEAEEVYFELPLPADDVNKRSTAAIVAADEATIGKEEPLTRLVIGGA